MVVSRVSEGGTRESRAFFENFNQKQRRKRSFKIIHNRH